MNQEEFINKVQHWLIEDGQSTKAFWNLTEENQNAKISVEQTVCFEKLGRKKTIKRCIETENSEENIQNAVLELNLRLNDEIDQWLLECEKKTKQNHQKI